MIRWGRGISSLSCDEHWSVVFRNSITQEWLENILLDLSLDYRASQAEIFLAVYAAKILRGLKRLAELQWVSLWCIRHCLERSNHATTQCSLCAITSAHNYWWRRKEWDLSRVSIGYCYRFILFIWCLSILWTKRAEWKSLWGEESLYR